MNPIFSSDVLAVHLVRRQPAALIENAFILQLHNCGVVTYLVSIFTNYVLFLHT